MSRLIVSRSGRGTTRGTEEQTYGTGTFTWCGAVYAMTGPPRDVYKYDRHSRAVG